MESIWNDVISQTPEFWQAMGLIFGTVILLGAGVAASALAGTKALEYLKLLWAEIRGRRADIIGAVDDATDKIPVELGELTHIPPAVWSDILEALIKVVVQERTAPAHEVALRETVK